MKFSSEGKWGRGLYFAVNSDYSNAFAHTFENGDHGIFLAKVNIGETISLSSQNLVEPPQGKDSVQGKRGGSDIYIVYANKKAYPEFFIRYK